MEKHGATNGLPQELKINKPHARWAMQMARIPCLLSFHVTELLGKMVI